MYSFQVATRLLRVDTILLAHIGVAISRVYFDLILLPFSPGCSASFSGMYRVGIGTFVSAPSWPRTHSCLRSIAFVFVY